ncbi:PH (Pleckstrin Homology) domain-containing protein [Prosthecobacter fusiformis]|uniref:PH (Pleckstrin Homology) domain-containing protein n=1 Tax=Prosthecobacter fusiformis TaxID=48464 RepID=A0A4R7RK49_9BACT|nr:PH domain-containing protein [Prosthecobacter fusiformis]TDU63122.1 PH (Pleckstrin Homology) domain-containing protein [Prosthecobacter fusiformis]
MRYRLHEHPAFPGLLSKEDLFLLVERGSLARGDLCADTVTGRDHTVGDVIGEMREARARAGARIDRPMFREIRADDPGEVEEELPGDDEAEEEGLLDPEVYTPAGELILHRSHPSWLGAGKALFLVMLLWITTGMLMRVEPDYAPLSAMLGMGVLVAVWVARATRVYLVTEERVEVVWGILGKSSKEVRICDIRSIDVYESGLKGLLGLGTVDFSSAANAGIEVQFRDIRGAHAVKELVRQLQRGTGRSEGGGL